MSSLKLCDNGSDHVQPGQAQRGGGGCGSQSGVACEGNGQTAHRDAIAGGAWKLCDGRWASWAGGDAATDCDWPSTTLRLGSSRLAGIQGAPSGRLLEQVHLTVDQRPRPLAVLLPAQLRSLRPRCVKNNVVAVASPALIPRPSSHQRPLLFSSPLLRVFSLAQGRTIRTTPCPRTITRLLPSVSEALTRRESRQ